LLAFATLRGLMGEMDSSTRYRWLFHGWRLNRRAVLKIAFSYSSPAWLSADRDIDNFNVLLRLLLVDLCILDSMHDVQSLHGSAKDGMLAIQPGL
jgi:hypothetical protein